MNKLKKLASLVLALVMALALAAPALAADTYTITINGEGVKKDQVFDAYQIFDGDLYEESGENNTTKKVLSNIVWGSGVNVPEAEKATAKLPDAETGKTAAEWAEELEKNTAKDNDAAKAFADMISQHLAAAPTATGTSDADGHCVISVTDAGYYFVKNRAGTVGSDDGYTRYILEVVSDVTVQSKADTTQSSKKITGVLPAGEEKTMIPKSVDGVDVSIGDTVQFTLTATLPSNYADYTKGYSLKFNDTMSAGLEFQSIAGVTVVREGETDPVATFTKDNQYRETTDTATDGGTILTVIIDDLTKDGTFQAGDVVTVVYTAKLGNSAVIGVAGNPNELTVDFSNDPNNFGDGHTGTTPPDKVVVFTFELDGNKVDGNDTTKKLAGAEFKLQAGEGHDHAGEWVIVDETTGKITGWTTNENDASTLTTAEETGMIKIYGLDSGVYNLKEIKAPNGYNLPADPVFVITLTATIPETSDEPTVTELKLTNTNGQGEKQTTVGGTADKETGIAGTDIANFSGATLPSTGGIGTTLFYVVGGVLAVGAVILLITKRRMNIEK